MRIPIPQSYSLQQHLPHFVPKFPGRQGTISLSADMSGSEIYFAPPNNHYAPMRTHPIDATTYAQMSSYILEPFRSTHQTAALQYDLTLFRKASLKNPSTIAETNQT